MIQWNYIVELLTQDVCRNAQYTNITVHQYLACDNWIVKQSLTLKRVWGSPRRLSSRLIRPRSKPSSDSVPAPLGTPILSQFFSPSKYSTNSAISAPWSPPPTIAENSRGNLKGAKRALYLVWQKPEWRENGRKRLEGQSMVRGKGELEKKQKRCSVFKFD